MKQTPTLRIPRSAMFPIWWVLSEILTPLGQHDLLTKIAETLPQTQKNIEDYKVSKCYLIRRHKY